MKRRSINPGSSSGAASKQQRVERKHHTTTSATGTGTTFASVPLSIVEHCIFPCLPFEELMGAANRLNQASQPLAEQLAVAWMRHRIVNGRPRHAMSGQSERVKEESDDEDDDASLSSTSSSSSFSSAWSMDSLREELHATVTSSDASWLYRQLQRSRNFPCNRRRVHVTAVEREALQMLKSDGRVLYCLSAEELDFSMDHPDREALLVWLIDALLPVLRRQREPTRMTRLEAPRRSELEDTQQRSIREEQNYRRVGNPAWVRTQLVRGGLSEWERCRWDRDGRCWRVDATALFFVPEQGVWAVLAENDDELTWRTRGVLDAVELA